VSEKSSEKSNMSEIAWASDTLRNYVAPKGSAQYVETRIRNAARVLGWKFSRAREIWYADERVAVRPRELRQIEDCTGLRYGRQELQDIDRLIGRADALLMGDDQDIHRAFAAAFRAFLGSLHSSRVAGDDR